MQVPFFSLAEQTAQLKSELVAALTRTLETQGFSNGPAVAAFEQELAAYLGVKEVVALQSGTTALHAALRSLEVEEGDEVLTVSHTFIATAWAISYVGATPSFVDIDGDSCGMSPAELARRIGPKTRAILPVHLYGHPVDMDPILEVADRHQIPVIEDCAQSMGARYKGRLTGTMGRINATSFYPSKNLGACGEGGAVMTQDAALAARVRQLRDHAQSGRHHHVELGFNWRMDGFQGAVLSLKLPHLDGWNRRRQELAARYRNGLAETAGLKLLSVQRWASPSWHIFPVFHAQRDVVREALLGRGVQTAVHYPTPIHLQPAYAHLGLREGDLPQAERAARTQLSLPMFPELTDEAVDYVIAMLREVCASLHKEGV